MWNSFMWSFSQIKFFANQTILLLVELRFWRFHFKTSGLLLIGEKRSRSVQIFIHTVWFIFDIQLERSNHLRGSTVILVICTPLHKLVQIQLVKVWFAIECVIKDSWMSACHFGNVVRSKLEKSWAAFHHQRLIAGPQNRWQHTAATA